MQFTSPPCQAFELQQQLATTLEKNMRVLLGGFPEEVCGAGPVEPRRSGAMEKWCHKGDSSFTVYPRLRNSGSVGVPLCNLLILATLTTIRIAAPVV
jgi:hypothetical protein